MKNGGEFQVNTYTTSNQSYPAVGSDSSGNFVVVWESNKASGDASGHSIQGQRYASDGSARGSQFQINNETLGSQRLPIEGSHVSMNPDGKFVVVWRSRDYGAGGGDGDGSSVQGRCYASDGAPLGLEFQINSYTTGNQELFSTAMTPDDGFVAVWDSQGSLGSDTDATSIQARRFTADCTPIGGDFQVNTYTTGVQRGPTVATDDGGRFIVVWQSGNSTQAQFFDSDGTAVGSEFEVSANGSRPDVAMGPDRSFTVVWTIGDDGSNRGIRGRRYTTAPPCPPDFSKSFVPNPIDFGEWTTLTFTIDNTTNPVAVDNLAFTDNLPPGTVIANPPGSVNGCGGDVTADAGTAVISLTGGSVAAGSTCTLQVDVDATFCGMHVNTTGDLTSDTGNSGPASDTLTVDNCPVELELTKTESVDPVVAGSGPGNLTYTITVRNNGLAPATGLVLSEALNLLPGVAIDRRIAHNPLARVAIWQAIGDVYQKASEFEAAREAYGSAQEIRERAWGESLAFARGLHHLGALDWWQGRLDSTQGYWQRALEIRQKLAPGSLGVAESLNNLGILAQARGDLDLAAEYCEGSLEIQQKLGPGSLHVAASLKGAGPGDSAEVSARQPRRGNQPEQPRDLGF